MWDPIFENSGKWYFWIETWADFVGPYDTELEALEALREYCAEVLGG